jgi:hypothetical protein
VDLWRKMMAYLIFSHPEENILIPSPPDWSTILTAWEPWRK